MDLIAKHRKIFLGLVFAFAVLFRIWLSDKSWHVDMWSNAGWGEWIYEHGPKNFYTNQFWTYSWPTQPPLVNSIYASNKKLFIDILGRSAWVEHQLKKIFHQQKR